MVSASALSGCASAAATAPSEGVMHTQPDTTAYLNHAPIGHGTLYITDKVLTWFEETKKLGFSLEYPNISLHAIRRDPFPSLYMMIDHKLELPEGLAPPNRAPARGEDSGEESDENAEEEHPMTELMFAPNDEEMLSTMFSVMNECQAMHPDPNDSFSDDDDDIYEDASEVMEEDNAPVIEVGDPVEEEMEGLHIESNNGHSENNGNMDYDPDQFADD